MELYEAIERLNNAASKEVAMRLQVDERKEAEDLFKYDSDLDDPDYDEFWEELGA